jgi:hypothetical protein
MADVLWWVAFVLLVLTVVPSVLYYFAWLATGEPACKHRAALFYRWAVMVVLMSVIVVVYTRVVRTLIEMFS